MKPDYKWARLAQLSGIATHEILMARESVFVVEQDCPYQDADEHDAHAWHLVGRIGGELACYARLVDPGHKYDEPSIGRVLTTARFRRQQLGRPLMLELLSRSQALYPTQPIRISAQAYLEAFYQSLGFRQVGQPYLEDNIPHLEMLWQPTS